ncbi:MAG: hypothetical protein O2895_02080 [Chloroflexi bacterium]|nr:hypothetical protein [Chloroflexota bacterium]
MTTTRMTRAEAAERLSAIRDQMLDHLDEARGVLHEAVGDGDLIAKRAEAYWLGQMTEALGAEPGCIVFAICSLADTIGELDGEDDGTLLLPYVPPAITQLESAAPALMAYLKCCAEGGDVATDVVADPSAEGLYGVRRGDTCEGWLVATADVWDFEEVSFGTWPPLVVMGPHGLTLGLGGRS